MRAIILDMHSANRGGQEVGYGKINTPVLNKPLLVHHIENLKNQGITEITLLSDQQLPATLCDGKRWGIDLNIVPTLDPSWVVKKDNQSWVIIPGNYLVEFKIDEDLQDLQDIEGEGVRNSISATPEYFHPMQLHLKEALEVAEQKAPLTPAMLINFIERQDTHSIRRYRGATVFEANNYSSVWKTSQDLFHATKSPKNMAGFPLADGIWGDVGTRIHESCTADGFVLIGESSRIHKNVQLKGLVVIGNNVVIDEGSILEDTIIFDDTYVGKQMSLKQAVADQKILYRADLDTAIEIEDSFLLNSTH